LIGEGDSVGIVRTNLFDAKNTVASCFNGFFTQTGQSRKYFAEFQTARTFTNASTVNAACTPTQNFGGSLCDQTGRAKDFYNAINSIRTNPTRATTDRFADQLLAW
jgi:hypothetical protein